MQRKHTVGLLLLSLICVSCATAAPSHEAQKLKAKVRAAMTRFSLTGCASHGAGLGSSDLPALSMALTTGVITDLLTCRQRQRLLPGRPGWLVGGCMPPMLWPRLGGPLMALLKRPWVSHALCLLCSNFTVQQTTVNEAPACCAATANCSL